jgi:hypothetical protein
MLYAGGLLAIYVGLVIFFSVIGAAIDGPDKAEDFVEFITLGVIEPGRGEDELNRAEERIDAPDVDIDAQPREGSGTGNGENANTPAPTPTPYSRDSSSQTGGTYNPADNGSLDAFGNHTLCGNDIEPRYTGKGKELRFQAGDCVGGFMLTFSDGSTCTLCWTANAKMNGVVLDGGIDMYDHDLEPLRRLR